MSTPPGRRPAATRRPASPAGPADRDPQTGEPIADRTAPRRAAALRDRLRGPWRVAVTESSMTPAIEPGDWLLVDPTVGRWSRRGSVVVFREPDSEQLAIKRVAAGPGDRVPYADGYLILGADEAWLLSDASDAALLAAGHGQPV